MKQTRFHSLVEVVTSTFIGYMVAVGSQIVIFPMFNIHIPLSDNFLIGMWFTVVSLIRSYVIRRWFNNLGSEIDDFLARLIVRFEKLQVWMIGFSQNKKSESSSFQRSDFHREKNVDFHSRKNVEFTEALHPSLQEIVEHGRQNKTEG